MRSASLLGIVCALGVVLAGYVFLVRVPEVQTNKPARVVPTPPKSGVEIRHRNEVNHFSFEIPAGYSAFEYDVEERKAGAVVVQNQAGRGALILATPFIEAEAVLTPERIKKDVPHLSVTNVQEVLIAEEVPGLAFDSSDAVWDGNAREVWFVHRHTLFQLSALRTDTQVLEAIVDTWRFEPVK